MESETPQSWLTKNIAPLLALIIILGGGSGIIWSPDTDVRLGLTAIVSTVVGFYFGTSSGNRKKDETINNLSTPKE